MSTSVYTGLNPFNFIRKQFLQVSLWDVSYVRSYCSFWFIKRAWAITIHCSLVQSDIPNSPQYMRREEKPTRCHCTLYCTYETLNMFRALLCPSSGALDYMYAIAAYGVQCLVAGCRGSGAGQQGVRPGRGMLHDSVVQHPSSWTHCTP